MKWFDEGSNILCTSDYNGSITAWDTRSTSVPLSTKEVHEGKGLCIEWGQSNQNNNNNNDDNENIMSENGKILFSGGSDCCIKSTNLRLG